MASTRQILPSRILKASISEIEQRPVRAVRQREVDAPVGLLPVMRAGFVLGDSFADDDPLESHAVTLSQRLDGPGAAADGGFAFLGAELFGLTGPSDHRRLRPELTANLARFPGLVNVDDGAVFVANDTAVFPINRHRVTTSGA